MKGVNYLLSAFITLTLGIVLLTVYADLTDQKTDLATKTDTFNIASARVGANNINTSYNFTVTKPRTGWKTEESICVVTIGTLTNNSQTLTVGNYTDYTDGKFSLLNTTDWVNSISNTSVVTYTYCSDDYLRGWAGKVQDTTVGLLAILLLGATVFFVYLALKDAGIVTK